MQRWIASQNIARYEALLVEEADPARRALISDLLAEQRRKLREAEAALERGAPPPPGPAE